METHGFRKVENSHSVFLKSNFSDDVSLLSSLNL